MIRFEHTETCGFQAAVRGMRNPLNSWAKSDSKAVPLTLTDGAFYELGPNDLDLMFRLRNAGTDHRKFMRMLTVYVDITAPLYWWKEFDTYKVGTVANSCSTMHTIHKKSFSLGDFSHEHLDPKATEALQQIIFILDQYRDFYMKDKNKTDWWQLIQLLPSSFNQKRTVMLNYEVLANMYKSRKNHKLDEWRQLCKWIESLPYSELITRKDEQNE